MNTTHSNRSANLAAARRVAGIAVAAFALASAASAQSASEPGPQAGVAPDSIPTTDTANPAPGGGAGPGKIEQGGTRQVTVKQIRYTNCPGDMNEDGVVDIGDLFAFFDLFDREDPKADMVPDRAFGIDDLFSFLVAFDEGC